MPCNIPLSLCFHPTSALGTLQTWRGCSNTMLPVVVTHWLDMILHVYMYKLVTEIKPHCDEYCYKVKIAGGVWVSISEIFTFKSIYCIQVNSLVLNSAISPSWHRMQLNPGKTGFVSPEVRTIGTLPIPELTFRLLDLNTLLLLEGFLSLPRSRRNGQHSKMADNTTM